MNDRYWILLFAIYSEYKRYAADLFGCSIRALSKKRKNFHTCKKCGETKEVKHFTYRPKSRRYKDICDSCLT